MADAALQEDVIEIPQGESDGGLPGSDAGQGSEETDVELRARRMGWKPQDEFRGPSNRWVDAETFVHKAETEFPLALNRLKVMDSKFVTLERQNERLGEMVEKLLATNATVEERTRAQTRADIQREIDEKAAVADVPGVRDATRRLAEHDAAAPAPDGTKKPTASAEPPASARDLIKPDPVIAEWMGRNAWFKADPKMATWAGAQQNIIAVEHPDFTLEENLIEVERRTREKFPEKFGTAPRNGGGSPPVMPSRPGAPKKTNGQSWDDLPKDVQATGLRQIKELGVKKDGKTPRLTKEEYARLFFQQP